MLIHVKAEKCKGCKTCELFCSFRRKRAINPSLSCISVISWRDRGTFIPMVCMQCETPYCREICPVNALVTDPDTGVLRVESSACIGCAACVSICPFGGISIDPETGKAYKCDLCSGKPECVAFCPCQTLELAQKRDLGEFKKRSFAMKYLESLKSIEEEK